MMTLLVPLVQNTEGVGTPVPAHSQIILLSVLFGLQSACFVNVGGTDRREKT